MYNILEVNRIINALNFASCKAEHCTRRALQSSGDALSIELNNCNWYDGQVIALKLALSILGCIPNERKRAVNYDDGLGEFTYVEYYLSE